MDKKLKSILKKEKLEHLLSVFVDQGITDSILGDLSDGDLRDLGIDKLGERKRLLTAFSAPSDSTSAEKKRPLVSRQEDFSYEAANGEITITGFRGKGFVVIPETFDDLPLPVRHIGDGAFKDHGGLLSIVIPDGVTSIGDSAFSGCSSLTSVTLPNSIVSIGHFAFSGCSSLTSIALPNSVVSIGDSAFSGCSSLTSVTLPSSAVSIGDSAFSGCQCLASLTISDSAWNYSSIAFDEYNCPAVQNAYLAWACSRKVGTKVAAKSVVAMVKVEGGTLPQGSEVAGTKVARFEIGKFAVTMQEWKGVRSWAMANGFGLEVGESWGDKHPVTCVSWYDCVKWCNAKSLMEKLEPVYGVKGHDGYFCRGEFGNDGSENVVLKPQSTGYRLPTEAEWEWAARGGRNKQGHTFAGSNNLNIVGWYSENSAGTTHAVGEKIANELGLRDISGNVWEWCCDLNESNRLLRGGSWSSPQHACAVGFRSRSNPGERIYYFGFRLARSL